MQEPSHKMETVRPEIDSPPLSMNPSTKSEQHVTNDTNSVEPNIIPAKAHKTSAGQRTDLPSWLIDQPTQFEMPALRPSSLSGSHKIPVSAKWKSTPHRRNKQKKLLKKL